jgi:hypothetical protein
LYIKEPVSLEETGSLSVQIYFHGLQFKIAIQANGQGCFTHDFQTRNFIFILVCFKSEVRMNGIQSFNAGGRMKKIITILFASLPGTALLVGLLLTGRVDSAQANPGILYVGPHGDCGGIILHCYSSIQAAVDAAANNDEIRVSSGVYTDTHVRPRSDTTFTGVVTQTVYITKTLTIRGGYNHTYTYRNPDLFSTTLDAQGKGRGLYISGYISPTIEGLRIIHGDATGQGGYDYAGSFDAGGGIYVYNSNPSLINNQIISSTAGFGGGVYMGESAGSLDGNLISNNHAITGGGGLFVYHGSVYVSANSVISNTSFNIAGGVYLFGTNSTLNNNRVIGNSASSLAGGIDVASCSPTFNGNILSTNVANMGGGVYLWYSSSRLTNNVIADNRANQSGSGMYIGGSRPTFLHTTLARNRGGNGSGIYLTGSGSGYYSLLTMTNTLLISHTIGISVTAHNTVTLNGVLWFGTPITISQVGANLFLQNQSTGNPLFDLDGYHLTSHSAAIDKGVPAGVFTDIDGQPRPYGAAPDLGADEYWPKFIFLPVVFRNH